MGKAGNFKQGAYKVGNVIDNATFSTAGRAGGIVANTTLDVLDTFNNLALRSAEITRTGNQDMRAILSESGRGNFWKRLLKVPIGVGLATGKFVESTVRSVVTPLWHGLRDGFDTLGNPIMNTGRAVTYMPNTNPADTYKFDTLAARDYKKQGWNWMKLMPWKKGSKVDSAPISDKHETPVAKEEHPAPVVVDDGSKKAIAELQKNFADLTAQYKSLQQQNASLQKNAEIADQNTKEFIDETKKESHHEEKKEKAPVDEKSPEDSQKKNEKKKIELSEEDKHAIVEKAETIQASLKDIVPKSYTIDREPTASGSQRVVIKRPGVTQKAAKPEFYLTVKTSNTVKIDYGPYDYYDEFHYTGEFDLSDMSKITDCVKAIVVAMQARKGDTHAFDKLPDVGMKKIVQKDLIDEVTNPNLSPPAP